MLPQANQEDLRSECRCFTRHLLGQSPSAYVVEQYEDFHRRNAMEETGLPPVESFLLSAGRAHPFLTLLADTYSSRFRKTSLLRKKLVLLLGLCECAPPHAEYIDRADGRNLLLLLRMTFAACRVAMVLPLSILVFAPVHLFSGRATVVKLEGEAR